MRPSTTRGRDLASRVGDVDQVPPSRDGRASLRFHQERLADADERARQRGHWRAVMDRIEDALDAGMDQD